MNIDDEPPDDAGEAELANIDRLNAAFELAIGRAYSDPTPANLIALTVASHVALVAALTLAQRHSNENREALNVLAERLDGDEPEWELGDPM